DAEHAHADHDHAPATETAHADDDHAHDDQDADHAHEHDHAAAAHDHADDGHDHSAHDHDAHDHAGHSHHGHHHDNHPLPENQREVTAILVRATNDFSAESLRTTINEGEAAQAVSPIRVISDFFKTLISGVTVALLSLTILIIVVAGVGVL